VRAVQSAAVTFDLRTETDLRVHPAAAEIRRVAAAFETAFDVAAARRGRRTIGLRSDRGTWVRIEARPAAHVDSRGWNGIECAAALRGVARPEWRQSITWRDGDLVWRADETALVTAPPVGRNGEVLSADPGLDDAWWAALRRSLTALAGHVTTRVVTTNMRPISQERVSAFVASVYPGVDTTIDEWTAAHGDLGWQNLTAPECVLLDWEDWGMAPRGLDAATLWLDSLAVPALAERVRHELSAELECRSGLVCQLRGCAAASLWPPEFAALAAPARAHAERVIARLRALS